MASSINWVWSIGIFCILMLSRETEGQRQVSLQDSFQSTLIPSWQQLFCINPALRTTMYNCFKGDKNLCALANDTFQFYMQHPDKKTTFNDRVEKMCTDQQYSKDFSEFVKCMDQHTSDWKNCKTQDMQFVAEMTENVKNQKPPTKDTMCDSQFLVVLKCYETVGKNVCAQTAKPVFGTITIGDNDGICTNSAAKISNTLCIGLIAVLISIWSFFHFK